MSKDKVTIDDIKFLMERLIFALDQFNGRIDNAHLLDNPSPAIKTKEPTKEDLKIMERLRMRVDFDKRLTQEEKDALLNPTPSQFAKFKREYRKSLKEINKEMAERTSAEILSLKRITIQAPPVNTVFDEKEVIAGNIVVSGYNRDYGTVGIMGKSNVDHLFPIEVFVCKQDFLPGKRIYQVTDQYCVLAILDPKLKSIHLSTHLIKLAIKHSVNFCGLIYVKPDEKEKTLK
jgi:hypothetical protein